MKALHSKWVNYNGSLTVKCYEVVQINDLTSLQAVLKSQ